jgi:hypothetical protein
MASLIEDLDTAASWISQALKASGYLADFSSASLWSIDRGPAMKIPMEKSTSSWSCPAEA